MLGCNQYLLVQRGNTAATTTYLDEEATRMMSCKRSQDPADAAATETEAVQVEVNAKAVGVERLASSTKAGGSEASRNRQRYEPPAKEEVKRTRLDQSVIQRHLGGSRNNQRAEPSARNEFDQKVRKLVQRRLLQEYIRSLTKLGDLVCWLTNVTEDTLKERGWDRNLLFDLVKESRDSVIIGAAARRHGLFAPKQLAQLELALLKNTSPPIGASAICDDNKESAGSNLLDAAPDEASVDIASAEGVASPGELAATGKDSQTTTSTRVDGKVRKEELREHVKELARKGCLASWVGSVTEDFLKGREWNTMHLLFQVLQPTVDSSVLSAAVGRNDLFSPKQLWHFKLQRIRLAFSSSGTLPGSSDDDANKLSETGSGNGSASSICSVHPCHIFVLGMPSYMSVAKGRLLSVLGWIGKVHASKVQIIDKNGNASTSTASARIAEPHWVVEYKNKAAACAAFAAFDGIDVCGAMLSVRLSSPSSKDSIAEDEALLNTDAILKECYERAGGKENWIELRSSVQRFVTALAKRSMREQRENAEQNSTKVDVPGAGCAGVPNAGIEKGCMQEISRDEGKKRPALSTGECCTTRYQEGSQMKRARLEDDNEDGKSLESDQELGVSGPQGRSIELTRFTCGNNTELSPEVSCVDEHPSLAVLMRENAQLKLELRDSQQDLSVANLKKDLALQEKTMASLQQQLPMAELKGKITGLEQEVRAATAERELATHKEENEDLQQQVIVANLKMEVATQNATVMELQQKLRGINGHPEKQKSQGQTTDVRDKEVAGAKIAELQSKLTDAEGSVQSTNHTLDNLRRRLAEVEAERDSFRQRSSSAEAANAKIEEKVGCVQEEVRSLQDEAKKLGAENDDLRQQKAVWLRNADGRKNPGAGASGLKILLDAQKLSSSRLAAIKEEKDDALAEAADAKEDLQNAQESSKHPILAESNKMHQIEALKTLLRTNGASETEIQSAMSSSSRPIKLETM